MTWRAARCPESSAPWAVVGGRTRRGLAGEKEPVADWRGDRLMVERLRSRGQVGAEVKGVWILAPPRNQAPRDVGDATASTTTACGKDPGPKQDSPGSELGKPTEVEIGPIGRVSRHRATGSSP